MEQQSIFKPGIYRNTAKSLFRVAKTAKYIELNSDQVIVEHYSGKNEVVSLMLFNEQLEEGRIKYLEDQDRAEELFQMSKSAARFFK